jgi:protein-S-isoprenylcysteine O-methyltransferase Ste14
MTKLFAFAITSAFLVYISRRSLLLPRSHGFYRFFAWESILGLVLLNVSHWEEDPYSPHQLVSWLLLFFSVFLVIHGVRLLQVIGKPDEQRPHDELLTFEKTTKLVTVGAYRYIRHPLYASLLFLTLGAFLKDPSLPGMLLASTSSLFLILTAKSDESECLQHFGNAYEAYMQKTKMFIPFLI